MGIVSSKHIRPLAPIARGRAPIMGKNRYIKAISYKDFFKVFEEAFPYLPATEIYRFLQLIFHEITLHLHERRVVKIPFFGNFIVKPKQIHKLYHRDIWNGYGEWVDLKKPIQDWTCTFEATPYLKHMCANRYTQQGELDNGEFEDFPNNIGTTDKWDRSYKKFSKRDVALRECPYSLATLGWAGYQHERIIKEALNAGETVRLTSKDGEVFTMTPEFISSMNKEQKKKFKDAYNKTKFYMDEIGKRKIFVLKRRNGLLKTWYKTYSNYLLDEKYEDVKDIENTIIKNNKENISTSYFYILKFGYKFEAGERRRLYKGYYFSYK